jgi:hypothetical protein
MAIKTGDLGAPGAFTGSMAEEIEIELNRLLTNDGLPALPSDDSQETRDRRRLFVAIARGVVRHLAENNNSLTTDIGGGTSEELQFDIDDLPGL